MGRLITSPLCHAQPVGQEHLCFALRLLALRPGPPTQSSLGPLVCTAGPGPPGRLSLAVTVLALCPFSTASLMHGPHMSAANPPALPPMPASASAWRLILSSRRAPLPCWAYTSRRPASYVGSNHGDQPLWTLARLSFALELRACLGSTLGLAAIRSFTLKLPAAPLDGPETMVSPGKLKDCRGTLRVTAISAPDFG